MAELIGESPVWRGPVERAAVASGAARYGTKLGERVADVAGGLAGWFATALLSVVHGSARYASADIPVRSARDKEIGRQIAAVDVSVATRAFAREIVSKLGAFGVRVNLAAKSPDDGITLLATGTEGAGYASIDVDDVDVIVGVSGDDGVYILDTSDVDEALRQVAAFLVRT